MKTKSKNLFWSGFVAFAMLFSLLLGFQPNSMKSVYASGEKVIVNEVEIVYDTSKIILNTAYTEGEVHNQIRNNTNTETTGTSINRANSGLSYENTPGNYWGVGDGSGIVSTEKSYALRYTIDLSSGYVWSDEVIAGDFTGFVTKLNGETVTLGKSEYIDAESIRVWIPLPTADTTPIVKNVSITDNALSIEKGKSHTFTGEVTGTVSDKTITWSVEGGLSANTVIDNDGQLTIGADETAETLTVKASATADNTKYASVTVTVLDEQPYISSVTLSPSTKTLYTGSTQTFTATVEGTQTDKSVTWSVEGGSSANTVINTNGELSIGLDETAETLTIKATANKDNSKVGIATVTVSQRTKITEFNLIYNSSNVTLSTEYTEGQVQQQIRDNISTDTAGVTISISNSGLSYIYSPGNYYGVADGTNYANPTRQYVIRCRLDLSNSQYDWSDNLKDENLEGFTFKINGENKNSEISAVDYSSSSNVITLYITLPEATCLHTSCSIVTGQAKTCDTDGWKDYYQCVCGEYFEDEDATTPISDLAAWKVGDGKIRASHSEAAEWIKTAATHEKKYTCCDVVVIEEENHHWENGECSECEYEATPTTLTATYTGTILAGTTINPSGISITVGYQYAPSHTLNAGAVEYWYGSNQITNPVAYVFGVELIGNLDITVKYQGLETTMAVQIVGHAITFNANGGTGEMTATEYVGNYTLPTCTFTAPEGKQFKGWATSANGEVIEGTTYNVTADAELFAIWEDIPQTPNEGIGAGALIGIILGSTLVLGVGGFALVWFVIKKKSWAQFLAMFKKK